METVPFPYVLTPSAVAFVLEEAQAAGVAPCLRAWVEGGGCSGFRYGFDFSSPEPDDLVEDKEGLVRLCDPLSAMYLAGATLDGQNDLLGRRLVWHHPEAHHTCGCGQSFSTGEG